MTARDAEADALWQRLAQRGLLGGAAAAVSLRLPGQPGLCWRDAAGPARTLAIDAPASGAAALHAAVYRARPDVGAVVSGGGRFARALIDFGARLPTVFDEQARHIGPPAPAVPDLAALPAALAGGGNALWVAGEPVCLGTTALRLALNAELLEKCVQAYLLAAAAGGPVRPLPWLVRWVTRGRLRRDQRRAAACHDRGALAPESQGY